MELREYLNLGLKWAWLLLLATAVAAVGAWIATKQLPRQYLSQSTLMVGRATQSQNPDWSDVYLSQNLALHERPVGKVLALLGRGADLDHLPRHLVGDHLGAYRVHLTLFRYFSRLVMCFSHLANGHQGNNDHQVKRRPK